MLLSPSLVWTKEPRAQWDSPALSKCFWRHHPVWVAFGLFVKPTRPDPKASLPHFTYGSNPNTNCRWLVLTINFQPCNTFVLLAKNMWPNLVQLDVFVLLTNHHDHFCDEYSNFASCYFFFKSSFWIELPGPALFGNCILHKMLFWWSSILFFCTKLFCGLVISKIFAYAIIEIK